MPNVAASTRPKFGIARRVRVPLGFAFAAFFLWRARPSWLALSIGALIAACGLALRALASGYVKKDRELTTTGPYSWVRNPLYLGSIAIASGFAVAARDIWIVVVVVVFFVAVYVPVIRSEEAFLRANFPEYEEYSSKVPRLIPRSLSFDNAGGGFSRVLYLQHREYNALFGAAAMLAALVVKMLWVHG
jgi:protein-S-isoprenylcysteine O-methyltransferase Ste14